MNRREARELAFAVLFEATFTDDTVAAILENAGEARKVTADTFARELAEGTLQKRDELDEKIEQSAQNWNKNRISRVAITLLRLAVYEMFYRDDVPVSVAINEAVELAKTYGGEEEASFINGVLGGIARRMPPQEP